MCVCASETDRWAPLLSSAANNCCRLSVWRPEARRINTADFCLNHRDFSHKPAVMPLSKRRRRGRREARSRRSEPTAPTFSGRRRLIGFTLIATCSAERSDRESFSSSSQHTVKCPADISTTWNNRKSKEKKKKTSKATGSTSRFSNRRFPLVVFFWLCCEGPVFGFFKRF